MGPPPKFYGTRDILLSHGAREASPQLLTRAADAGRHQWHRRHGGLVAEGAPALAPTLPHHHRYVAHDVHVGQAEADQLVPPHAGVEEHPDDGRVPPVLERLRG